MPPKSIDVLIVGAGPVGLSLAIGLAEKKIPFIIVDMLAEQQNTSRAAVVHAKTLEALEKIGMANPLIDHGRKTPYFRIRDKDSILVETDFRKIPSKTHYALMIPQDETERILLKRLSELGHQVYRPVTVQSINITDIGAAVQYEGPEGSGTVQCRYVIGCDGEKSTVRQQAKIDFPGKTHGSFLLADVKMTWPLPQDEVTLFFSDKGVLVVAPLPMDRYRVVAQLEPAPQHPSIEDVKKLLTERGPSVPVEITELLWGSRFQVHHKLAETFCQGPVLLAGDAAHVHSPAGGQGMNLGIRDAIALSEALENSLSHNVKEPLRLYAQQQRDAAKRVLSMTDRLTYVATLRNKMLRSLRNPLIQAFSSIPPVREALAKTLAGY